MLGANACLWSRLGAGIRSTAGEAAEGQQVEVQSTCDRIEDFDHGRDAGVAAERIVLDPGFGFGKSVAHNYTLLRALPAVMGESYPSLIGVSRKSMLGAVTGRPAGQRLGGSIAAALAAAARGANILRVHDVADTVAALKIWSVIEQGVRA